mmetsp:Transcript_457/g.776  ORF Transcript_457/g.776 Transcript_457/m.776 type:complete len:94 (-) Transcript_457:324-605(-)
METGCSAEAPPQTRKDGKVATSPLSRRRGTAEEAGCASTETTLQTAPSLLPWQRRMAEKTGGASSEAARRTKKDCRGAPSLLPRRGGKAEEAD